MNAKWILLGVAVLGVGCSPTKVKVPEIKMPEYKAPTVPNSDLESQVLKDLLKCKTAEATKIALNGPFANSALVHTEGESVTITPSATNVLDDDAIAKLPKEVLNVGCAPEIVSGSNPTGLPTRNWKEKEPLQANTILICNQLPGLSYADIKAEFLVLNNVDIKLNSVITNVTILADVLTLDGENKLTATVNSSLVLFAAGSVKINVNRIDGARVSGHLIVKSEVNECEKQSTQEAK